MRQVNVTTHAKPSDDTVDGHVWLDGEQIQRYASKEVARRSCWRKTPLRRAISPIQELVARGALSASAIIYPLAQGRCRRAVISAMRATGITSLATQSVDTLSGGQRQRAWIAMVLAQKRPSCCWMSRQRGWILAIKLICWSC
ncbi:ATP-binding cassette domain-containing protein [Salmonella enterica subsp. enterica]|nr:ATP-binding cassette domain-containing protein [Salmonella enterica subsp. enterica]